MVDADFEGIVAKKLADSYNPKRARWHKILNRDYSSVPDAPNGSASDAHHPHSPQDYAASRVSEAAA